MRPLYSDQVSPDDLHERIADEILARLRIVKREDWHADPPKRPLEPDWDYRWITIHHTG
jgi:hypothetical protein